MKPGFHNGLLAVLFFIIACENKEIVDEQVMIESHVHVMITKELYKNHKDSLKIKVNETYSKFGITEKKFLKTLESYSDDKEKWDRFFEQSLIYLDSLRRRDNVMSPSALPKQF